MAAASSAASGSTPRLEARDLRAPGRDQELGEVPAHLAGAGGRRELLIEGRLLRPLDLDLGEHGEGHVVLRRAERLDFSLGAGLLPAEVVGRKPGDHQALRLVLLIQGLEAGVLPRETAARGDVHEQQRLAAEGAQRLGRAVDVGQGQVEHFGLRGLGGRRSSRGRGRSGGGGREGGERDQGDEGPRGAAMTKGACVHAHLDVRGRAPVAPGRPERQPAGVHALVAPPRSRADGRPRAGRAGLCPRPRGAAGASMTPNARRPTRGRFSSRPTRPPRPASSRANARALEGARPPHPADSRYPGSWRCSTARPPSSSKTSAPGVPFATSRPPSARASRASTCTPPPPSGSPYRRTAALTRQDNTPTATWLDFYRDRRLRPLLRTLAQRGALDPRHPRALRPPARPSGGAPRPHRRAPRPAARRPLERQPAHPRRRPPRARRPRRRLRPPRGRARHDGPVRRLQAPRLRRLRGRPPPSPPAGASACPCIRSTTSSTTPCCSAAGISGRRWASHGGSCPDAGRRYIRCIVCSMSGPQSLFATNMGPPVAPAGITPARRAPRRASIERDSGVDRGDTDGEEPPSHPYR
jgi:hypothetical protein